MPPLSHEQRKSLTQDLRNAMESRDLERGYGFLETHVPTLELADLHADDYRLAFELSRWAAMWSGVERVLTEEINRKPIANRPGITLIGFVHLRLTEAFTAFSLLDKEKDPAIVEKVKKAAEQVVALKGSIDAYYVACAHYCMGRALNYSGQWEEALHSMEKARSGYNDASCLLAVIDLQIHRLYLRLPHHHTVAEAEEVLTRAEARLKPTNDILNKAYIHYLRGRTLRYRGRYEEAAGYFNTASDLYREESKLYKGTPHRRILHALHGQARVLRLLAQSQPTEEKKLRAKSRELLCEAEALAKEIRQVSLHTLGTIALGKAYIALDEKNTQSAREEAERLLKRCEGYDDPALLSRIHLLLAKIAFKKGEWDSSNLKIAEQEADIALKLAVDGKHRRVRARAYILKGEIALESIPGPVGNDKAASYIEQAEALLPPEHMDYLRDELNELRTKVEEIQPSIKFEYRFDDLHDAKIGPFLEKIKIQLIQSTQCMYHNPKEMAVATGLAPETIAKYATGKYKSRKKREEQDFQI